MTKTIQTQVDANGDIHLNFSGFVGQECETEEDRIRRELASLGLNIKAMLFPKKHCGQSTTFQQSRSMRENAH